MKKVDDFCEISSNYRKFRIFAKKFNRHFCFNPKYNILSVTALYSFCIVLCVTKLELFLCFILQAACAADYQAGSLQDTEADQKDHAADAACDPALQPTQHPREKTGAPQHTPLGPHR